MENGERLSSFYLEGGVGIFFGTALVTTGALAWKERRALTLDWHQFLSRDENHGSSTPLSASLQRWIILSRLSILGVVVGLAFCSERYIEHFPKPWWDIDQFTSWVILVLCFAIYRERSDGSDLQELHTTNTLQFRHRILQELKGAAFIIYSFYEYFQHDDNNTRHDRLIPQLFATVYCWVTSFHHATYFHTTNDVTVRRILVSMMKPVSLCGIFGLAVGQREWMLYHVCFLEIWALFWTWSIFGLASHRNQSKWGLRFKVFLAALVGYIVWDIPNPRLFMWLFRIFFRGKTKGVDTMMWTWYQLTVRNHWSILFGVAFAINYPVTHLWQQYIEQRQQSKRHQTASSSLSLCEWKVPAFPGFIAMTIVCLVWNYFMPKVDSFPNNEASVYPAVWSILVVSIFVYLRTCTDWLRERQLSLFVSLGECTLEASVLYPHIFLSSNALEILSLASPGWSKVNFLVLMIAWFPTSCLVFRVFESLISALQTETGLSIIPILAVLTTFSLSLLSSTICAWFSVSMDWWLVLVVSIVSGWIVFSLLLNTNTDHVILRKSWKSRPFWMASLICVSLCCWIMANFVILSSSIDQSISMWATCGEAVQTGGWFPINTCNEATQSFAYREHHVASIGTCSDAEKVVAWGWNPTGVAEHKCNFGSRDRETLLRRILKHRNLTFVGDSMIRHLYHATCRQVGHRDAGAYNTTLGKWSDYSRHYQPDTTLDFRWAPFISQTIPIVQQMTKDVEGRPDALVIGGGAWDLLHNTRTKENSTSFDSNIGRLGEELNRLRKSGQVVIWVEPTEINTWALNTEDKHKYMREDQMILLREKYRQRGVAGAATFVLSGLAFTRDRVEECYDGVHYPFSVYNGGAQILLNAVEGLMPVNRSNITPYEFGSMARPMLALMAMLLLLICLVSMDPLFGVSYVIALFICPSRVPMSFYDDAMALQQEMASGLSSSIKSKSSDQVGDEDLDLNELDAFLQTATNGEGSAKN